MEQLNKTDIKNYLDLVGHEVELSGCLFSKHRDIKKSIFTISGINFQTLDNGNNENPPIFKLLIMDFRMDKPRWTKFFNDGNGMSLILTINKVHFVWNN